MRYEVNPDPFTIVTARRRFGSGVMEYDIGLGITTVTLTDDNSFFGPVVELFVGRQVFQYVGFKAGVS